MILKDVVGRYQWLCHAFCLMDNHYHLLVETLDGKLSLGMRHLNGVYTLSEIARHLRFHYATIGRIIQGAML